MTKERSHELAWAAGFFDGEGSTYLQAYYGNGDRAGRLMMSVGQSGYELPSVLTRFHEAVQGLGKVVGPYGPYPKGKVALPVWRWQIHSKSEIPLVGKLLWPYLSPTKKAQFKKVLLQYKKNKDLLKRVGK